jgi:hypothetical protein
MTMPDDQYLPLTPRLKATITPDMIRIHDFGPPLGVSEAVSLRDFTLLAGITEEEMRRVDRERKKKGLEPLFED